MKKVVLICTAAVVTATFLSCKNNNSNDPVTSTSEVEMTSEINTDEIAMVTSDELTAEASTQYMYVTAPSGLSLREYNNLQSEKLARMPYGTKVTVVNAEGKSTMKVGGIQGAMDEVAFNHKKGFAFNGYLSKYFPPERDITAKGYASELQVLFKDVVYTSAKGGTASQPTSVEAITLPGSEWHEAFFTAQRLFDFPKEFKFPNPKGKKTETIFDGKPKKGVWVSQLEVSRADDELQKIEYVYSSEKFDSKVTIEKVGDAMKISKSEGVK